MRAWLARLAATLRAELDARTVQMLAGAALYALDLGRWSHVGVFLAAHAVTAPWISARLARKGA